MNVEQGSNAGAIPPALSSSEKGWFGHPRGLSTLFFTEMWERLSYYGMRALLILYMVAPVETGGLGFTKLKAGVIYGWYTMLVYALGLPGGILADRLLGQYNAIFLGGCLIVVGEFSLALPGIASFYVGLGLIAIGTGLLKPNATSMVGSLYAPGDPRREGGFSLYYLGINVGATIAPFICGTLGQKVFWELGFIAAGFGMIVGLVQLSLGKARLRSAIDRLNEGKQPEQKGSETTDTKLKTQEWSRLGVIAVLFFFAMIFYAALEQAGSSLNLFADKYTKLPVLRESGASNFSKKDFVDLPALASKLKQPNRPVDSWLSEQLSDTTKAALSTYQVTNSDNRLEAALTNDFNTIIAGASIYDTERLRGVDLRSKTKELLAQNPQGDDLARLNRFLLEDAYPLDLRKRGAMPSSWFQSLNPFFVIVFAPIFAWMWKKWGARQPSSPAKFAYGLLLMSFGFLLLAPAAGFAQSNAVQVSGTWLVGVYLVSTLGELCLSPVGLSMVTKLAPARIVGSVMGLWFWSMALGNLISGLIGGQFEKIPLWQLFGGVFVVPFVAGLILLLLVRPLKRMMGGVS